MSEVWVYALRFEDGAIYVGMTNNLNRRMTEHRRRQSSSTRRLTGDFKVVYQKSFADHAQARVHEKYMKSGGGRQLLKSVST